MYARVVTMSVRRDKVDECIGIVRDAISPEALKQKGFHDNLLLTNRSTGKSMLLSLWESEADLLASESGGYYGGQLGKLQQHITVSATREICSVAINDLGGLNGGTLYGRLTTMQFPRGAVDDGTHILRDSILPEARKQKGYAGLLSLTETSTGKGYSLSCWRSKVDMLASESGGYYSAQVTKLHPLLLGQPLREVFDVTAPLLAMPAIPTDARRQPPAP